MRVRRSARISVVLATALVALVLSACRPPARATRSEATPSATTPAAETSAAQRDPVAGRDLAIDESLGGHTLARHVGKSDAELAERLRREPRISAASTYTDRATAERAVGAALAGAGRRLTTWERRSGRRPNLVLNYVDPARRPLGRSLHRSQRAAQPARRAVVVLRWHERSNRFYVLTSYPEGDR
jgi:hypothetical protein